MRNFVALFLATLLLFMLQHGWAAKCRPPDIDISQKLTGNKYDGSPEYEVVINNACECPQANVLVNCIGFTSKEAIDPNVFKRKSEVDCLVNNGNPIHKNSPLKFKYARESPYYLLVVVHAEPLC